MKFDLGQREALEKLKSGKILCGGVGSGKSRTALAYYFVKECGGSIEPRYSKMKHPKDLYIITTAKKRDTLEWDDELAEFTLTRNEKLSIYPTKVVIDSWNNIGKYTDVENSFFIFDEQRLVGSGAWVKAFYKITDSSVYYRRCHNNRWILLSATPGDTWTDYIPVFVANKFYRNKSDFEVQRCIFEPFNKYHKIRGYIGEKTLEAQRDALLVDIRIDKHTVRHYENINVDYDHIVFKDAARRRWNIFEDKPMRQVSELYATLRRIVNENPNRIAALLDLYSKHNKIIVFYNFDYELENLRAMCNENDIRYSEWNGHHHQPIPDTDTWIYLVQYAAGSEGWNCTLTDTIVFYSLSYSYKMTEQAAGRIDRRNTDFTDLYYYFLMTDSWIDKAIKRDLDKKKNFNEKSHFNSVFA